VVSRDVISPRDQRPRGDRPQRDFPQYADPSKDIVHTRTRIAIEQTLKSKGLTQVSDPNAADFLVDYQVGVEGHRERVAEPVCWSADITAAGSRGAIGGRQDMWFGQFITAKERLCLIWCGEAMTSWRIARRTKSRSIGMDSIRTM
jgi:hypothetical protein